jgi:hypothetical protein
MLNLAQVGSVLCVVSLALAFNGGTANAGLSSFCVAVDGGTTSLLVQVKDKKPKKKKHGDDQSENDTGLTDCTIVSPGGGGGCKTGFNYVCEKLKSGKKCCGCVADNNAEAPKKDTTFHDRYQPGGTDTSQPEPGTDASQAGKCNVLIGDYCHVDQP